MVNAVGWAELFDGNMISAVYTMLDTAMGSQGIPITIFIFLTQIMLYWKTKNWMLVLTLGAMFTSMFMLQGYFLDYAKGFMFIVLTFNIAGVLYRIFFK